MTEIAEELRALADTPIDDNIRYIQAADGLMRQAAAELDRLKARNAELERVLLLTPMAERVAELPDFMAALSEWGREDPNQQADEITKFLNSTVGLREYLEDQTKAGGRDGH